MAAELEGRNTARFKRSGEDDWRPTISQWADLAQRHCKWAFLGPLPLTRFICEPNTSPQFVSYIFW